MLTYQKVEKDKPEYGNMTDLSKLRVDTRCDLEEQSITTRLIQHANMEDQLHGTIKISSNTNNTTQVHTHLLTRRCMDVYSSTKSSSTSSTYLLPTTRQQKPGMVGYTRPYPVAQVSRDPNRVSGD